MSVQLFHGDCREVLATLPDCSVDSIVTDPPYELGFMGKSWDAAGIAYDVTLWGECLRVLKPGGHLLAFGGTRTYHRMSTAIEDAGFEIRDSIHWLYGSGFPKSLDVSKAIDKRRDDSADHARREVILTVTEWVREARDAAGIKNRDIDAAFGFVGMAGHWTSAKSQPSVPTADQWPQLLALLGVDEPPQHVRDAVDEWLRIKSQPAPSWSLREVTGYHENAAPAQTWNANYGMPANPVPRERRDIPATDAARQWEGWGTALKPAHEPIVVARKPLVGTVAANVLEHGTGALNIDGTRVGMSDADREAARVPMSRIQEGRSNNRRAAGRSGEVFEPAPAGRWPANLVLTHAAECVQIGTQADTFGGGAKASSGFVDGYEHDGFAGKTVDVPVWQCAPGCPVAELDAQSGDRPSGARKAGVYAGKTDGPAYGQFGSFTSAEIEASTGGASRFFTVTEWDPIADSVPFRYVAKPSRRERDAGLSGLPEGARPTLGNGIGGQPDQQRANNRNIHPTVKPIALMRWLVRLVTPQGGTVLEPFAGSGTTLAAAILEGFDAIGIELTAEYLPIIEGRIAWAQAEVDKPDPPTAAPVPIAAEQVERATQVSLFDEDAA